MFTFWRIASGVATAKQLSLIHRGGLTEIFSYARCPSCILSRLGTGTGRSSFWSPYGYIGSRLQREGSCTRPTLDEAHCTEAMFPAHQPYTQETSCGNRQVSSPGKVVKRTAFWPSKMPVLCSSSKFAVLQRRGG